MQLANQTVSSQRG